MPAVLFVCLGNICRSPMAEGILRKKLASRGLSERFEVDSAGTAGYHAGERADPRTLEVLRRRDAWCDMRSRQVVGPDMDRFDWVVAMDRSNLTDLDRQMRPGQRAQVVLALEPTTNRDVPDPYYGGPGGFDAVYDMLDEALDAWLERWAPADG